MIDNRFMIFMCTTYNLASPIVGHCQHCRYKNRGLIILYLTTILTMIDNFYDIHECNIQSCISYCRPLSNIVVLNNKGLDNFVFNDNTDND